MSKINVDCDTQQAVRMGLEDAGRPNYPPEGPSISGQASNPIFSDGETPSNGGLLMGAEMDDQENLGWIKLHRRYLTHPFYLERRSFSKNEAWLDLLLRANYSPCSFVLGAEIVHAQRGEVISSELKLSERWRWSRTKVRDFVNLLCKEQMAVKKSDNKKTCLFIIKYDTYQSTGPIEKHQKNNGKTSEEQRRNTIKKEKKDKEGKEVKDIYGEFQNVLLTKDEHCKLIESFMESGTKERIENLSSYIASKGKKYSSHYATILTWERKNNGSGMGLGERTDRGNGSGPYRESKGKSTKYAGLETVIRTGAGSGDSQT